LREARLKPVLTSLFFLDNQGFLAAKIPFRETENKDKALLFYPGARRLARRLVMSEVFRKRLTKIVKFFKVKFIR